jgi:hypothetical protein
MRAIHITALEGADGVGVVRDLRNVLCYQHSIVDQQRPHAHYILGHPRLVGEQAVS